jgi:NAD(P)-dependent dehydrogenase (short-subunit alcohol dehydrogenase family)/alkylhydroperoxidase family enzyme
VSAPAASDSPLSGGVRLAGLDAEHWNDDVRTVLTAALENVRRAGAAAGGAGAPAGDPLPTLTLIAHQQHLLGPFLGWAAALAGTGELPRADAELVALRTAWSCRSLFEWREHRNYGRAAGLDDGQLAAIAEGPSSPTWTPRQRALLQAADELHHDATVTPATWAALSGELTPGEVVEVVLVVGQYRMLSSLVNAAGTDAVIGAPPQDDPVGRRIAADLAGAPWLGSSNVPDDLLGLRGAVALVTGGARSIGRGCALALARAGAHVVIADLADAGDAVAEIRALGRASFAIEADMRSPEAVEAMVARVVEHFGRLDVAVNTVGSTSGPKPLLDVSPAEWREVVEQNLTTTLLCMQAEALAMIRAGIPGRIVNVSSLSGMVGSPNAAGYGAANAAVGHLTRSAALEFARYGIRVNCIVPGTHLTETVREALEHDARVGAWIRTTEAATPLGRLGDPLEAGGVAVFLASSLSGYVTGHELVTDGGVRATTARPPMGGDAEAEAVRSAAT